MILVCIIEVHVGDAEHIWVPLLHALSAGNMFRGTVMNATPWNMLFIP
jgi:hypothetical protein